MDQTRKQLKILKTIQNLDIYCINIHYTLKNTIIFLTKNNDGSLIGQWSTQSLKKIDRKKNTTYNIQLICIEFFKFIKLKKLKYFKLVLKGSKNYNRKFILKNFKSKKLNIITVLQKNLITFNGCRPKKKKRR